ncbi:MAG: tetratricopeptide (TPR) repeat protein [Aureispira sp.]|jgi:tetratricopeptide (TPR) repeat protein
MEKVQLIEALDAAVINYQYETFQELAKQAITEYSEEAFGYYYLSESLLLESIPRYDEAEVCLAKALEFEPDSLKYLVKFGQLKQLLGRFDDAQIVWGKVLKLDPENSTALIAKASFLITQYQEFEQGLDLINQAILISPEELTAYLYRADALSGLGQHETALVDVDLFLAAQETFSDIGTLSKINILKELGRIEETFPLYEQVIEFAPENHIHQFNYGQSLLNQESFTKAAEHLGLAAELVEEKHSMFYRTLGQACLYALELDKALVALQTCIELDPNETEAFLMLIQTKVELEQFQEALDDSDKLLKKEAEDKSLIERVLLLKGTAFLGLKKYQAAEDIYTPLAKTKGLRQKDALYGLGTVFYESGDSNKAYRFMKAAKIGRHDLAQEYINAYLQDFLEDIKERSLKANEAEYSKNEASPFLQQLFGKLWKFSDLESKKLEDWPADQAQKAKDALSAFSMLLTEKGAVLVSDDKEEVLTYRIKKEVKTGALLEFLPLDNFPSFVVKLKLNEGGFTFSKEANEVLHLEQQDLATVPTAVISNYKKHLRKESVAYLGAKAAPIVEVLL